MEVRWEHVLERKGLHGCRGKAQAWFEAVGWLCLYHVPQPLSYYAALYTFWAVLDNAQRWFGMIVAFRETLYLVGCFVGLILRPEYLFISLTATTGRFPGTRCGTALVRS
eukprot:6949545-Prymnesium_polylepis.1